MVSNAAKPTDKMIGINGTIFFKGYTSTYGYEVWKSDGTSSGTVLLKDIRPGTWDALYSTTDANFTNLNGTLIFVANYGSLVMSYGNRMEHLEVQ